MKKILNDPFEFVNDMMKGIIAAHGDAYKLVDNDPKCLVRSSSPIAGKVAVATGGGSGHLPVFLGYVGDGLVDGCSVGNVFSSPTARQMLKVTRAIDSGAGILYLYGRYQGDVMNFEKAAEMAREEGIQVETLTVSDDVASSPPDQWENRRGIAGLFFAYKVAGAKARMGAPLQDVKETTQKALKVIRTLGIATSSCILPAVGKKTFDIEDDKMEIGMGIHGEAGIERTQMKSSREIAQILVDAVAEDLPFSSGDDVAILVNSLGGTPLEELYVLYGDIVPLMEERGLHIYKKYVGRFACSMEMQGVSLTMMKLDDELKELMDAAVDTPILNSLSQ